MAIKVSQHDETIRVSPIYGGSITILIREDEPKDISHAGWYTNLTKNEVLELIAELADALQE